MWPTCWLAMCPPYGMYVPSLLHVRDQRFWWDAAPHKPTCSWQQLSHQQSQLHTKTMRVQAGIHYWPTGQGWDHPYKPVAVSLIHVLARPLHLQCYQCPATCVVWVVYTIQHAILHDGWITLTRGRRGEAAMVLGWLLAIYPAGLNSALQFPVISGCCPAVVSCVTRAQG